MPGSSSPACAPRRRRCAGRTIGRAARDARPERAARARRALLPQPPERRRRRHADRQSALGIPPQESPHDVRALALFVHAEHDEHRRHGSGAGQVSRSALRAARDQGRRGGARALALPDDPDGSEEARAEGVGADPRKNGAVHRPAARAPHAGNEQGDVPPTALRRRRHRRQLRAASRPMLIVGLDVGSTTVKAAVANGDEVVWKDYKRHNTKQAEMVLEFLGRIEAECGLSAGRDRIILTGSGAGIVGPLLGGKHVQEVVALSAAVERLHPDVNFVSEIGGEDMKTLFFTPSGDSKTKQVFMQSACSGGTGTFIEKTARKLQVSPERLAEAAYSGLMLHKISSKCGIFAEADANTLVKSGVPVEEILASLYEAVVYQNLATLTKGNTPQPGVLLLGGPNLFFTGLQQAWRHHLGKLWAERKIAADPASAIQVPKEALYYACLGCIEIGNAEQPAVGIYSGRERMQWWIEKGQWEAKARDGAKGLVRDEADMCEFVREYGVEQCPAPRSQQPKDAPVLVGCDRSEEH